MKYFDLDFMSDFLNVLKASDVPLEHEHVARYSYNGLQNEIDFLTSQQNFVCLHKSLSGAFLERHNNSVELLRPGYTPEHVGWRVFTIDDFKTLFKNFTTIGREDFTLLSKHTVNEENLQAVMFQHKNGAVVQIVWRKDPIFSVDPKSTK